MDENPQRPRTGRPQRRIWWCVRLLVWPLVLAWFAHYAYVHWTTPPAAALRAVPDGSSAADDRAVALREALRSLPGYRPPAPSPSAAPTKPARPALSPFGDDLAKTVWGKWEPADRPLVASAAQYLATPRVNQALDEIVAQTESWREGVAARKSARGALEAALGPVFDTVERVTQALVARARQRQVEQHDLTGALHDLCAAAFLQQDTTTLSRFGWYWRSMSSLGLILFQFTYLAQEDDLPPSAVAETIASLTGGMPLSPSARLRQTVPAEDELQALLDQHFTDDGNGNGWLVVSTLEMESVFGSRPLHWPQQSGFWNLFGPFFNDRQSAAAKLTSLNERIRGLDGLDYAAVTERAAAWEQTAEPGSILEPVAAMSQSRAGQFTINVVCEDLIWRRATVVALALSAYKHDHAEYPENLDELRPDYLTEVPLDLLTNTPFIYERAPTGGFTLRAAKAIPRGLWPNRRPDPNEGPTEYSLHRPDADD